MGLEATTAVGVQPLTPDEALVLRDRLNNASKEKKMGPIFTAKSFEGRAEKNLNGEAAAAKRQIASSDAKIAKLEESFKQGQAEVVIARANYAAEKKEKPDIYAKYERLDAEMAAIKARIVELGGTVPEEQPFKDPYAGLVLNKETGIYEEPAKKVAETPTPETPKAVSTTSNNDDNLPVEAFDKEDANGLRYRIVQGKKGPERSYYPSDVHDHAKRQGIIQTISDRK